jgi:FKBP-type peptidyl-prolyl cis-trans isomerase FkpA
MKKLIKMFSIALIAIVAISACKKEKVVDSNTQLGTDSVLIKEFVAKNSITGVKQIGTSGLYYKVIEPGSGTGTYAATTVVKVHYTGRLLSGTIFDKTTTDPISLKLGEVIVGWQVGIQQIRKGGKIRLFIPSAYGYGAGGQGTIPPNAVLDFDIELVDVQY